jgi:magnesium chelatase subunit H
VAGFESFNRELYQTANDLQLDLTVFADSDIRKATNSTSMDPNDLNLNPVFEKAVREADAFIGSLIFDYDDVLAVQSVLSEVQGPRLVFESATELMELNKVGSFSMMPGKEGPSGPPPVVQAVLSKFGSGKEEDKLAGYLKLLKVGPDLLKLVPGDKASDLRTWLECYRYWNQGGRENVRSMLQIVARRCQGTNSLSEDLPAVRVTPDMGLIHPVRYREGDSFFLSPSAYLAWRKSKPAQLAAQRQGFRLASDDAPVVAILLYRKHVITEQPYILDLLTAMERDNIIPVPIFINGVEAHTIVRDYLTSVHEATEVSKGRLKRPDSYQERQAACVDAIVNTIGFPLVGGPAGSMQAGRNVAVAEELLSSMNVPYVVSGPLLLQSIPVWQKNGVLGLQSVVLYSLPELDGAIDTVVLGGLVGDKIALIPERVRKLTSRLQSWVQLRRKPKSERKIAVSLYGFPPNVGAVGTAALLNVPKSLEQIIRSLQKEGYDLGQWADDPHASGESLVAGLSILSEPAVISGGAQGMEAAIEAKRVRAVAGDETVNACLVAPGGGLGGARVVAKDVTADELEALLGKYMFRKVRRAWSERDTGPGVTSKGTYSVSGLQIGNVWLFVQPLLGIEGDPMRLLFERDLTPHPQYCATYKWLQAPPAQGGFGADAVIHLGMHGTVEWLPGQPLGNDRKSWSDEMVGNMPNLYIYAGKCFSVSLCAGPLRQSTNNIAANNPSESILAKRRGYGTLVSYNVPPYDRSGLYLELSTLKELVGDYRSGSLGDANHETRQAIYDVAQTCGMLNDVPLLVDANEESSIVTGTELPEDVTQKVYDAWVLELSVYLNVLQDRLFSSGLHVFGETPNDKEVNSYLNAYFGDKLSERGLHEAYANVKEEEQKKDRSFLTDLVSEITLRITGAPAAAVGGDHDVVDKASSIIHLLRKTDEELSSLMAGLDGGYIKPKPGGDLLRDGPSVLPTGRNTHALDPYRMPSSGAWARGQRAAQEILRQHKEANDDNFPETVAVALWGLDAIKTRGESVAIVLELVGARPTKEGTGRIVRFDLVPLSELGRPRVDVLASLSGIFRDSFANVVDLLDDMFERAASADEPSSMNFIKKHSEELASAGVSGRTAARLFSNPPGDYGNMVNEVVSTGDWDDAEALGETWRGRNVYSYGRNEGSAGSAGTARPEVLDKLLATTERVVQEIDSVEYGLSDIQEYYSGTGALKKAAENRKDVDATTGKRKKVTLSVIEAFGIDNDDASVPVKDVEEVLRMEYRSKLLNPKWTDAMLAQGSGGAFEVSQRMTAMIGWAATAEVDNFVFDQAAERYALDEEVAKKLQRANPEAFKNVVRRLLEAAGRGMWSTDDDTLEKLRDLYSDADDLIEQGSSSPATMRGRT